MTLIVKLGIVITSLLLFDGHGTHVYEYWLERYSNFSL